MNRLLTLLTLATLPTLISACGETTTLESGTYEARWIATDGAEGTIDLPEHTWSLSLSMEARTFHLQGPGFDQAGPLAGEDVWVPDCPTNLAAVDQHMVRLGLATLDVAGVVFEDPAVVASCTNFGPNTLVLQSAADVGVGQTSVIYFLPVQ